MNVPKRHHVVPEFYLRRFACDEVVDVLDRKTLQLSFSPTVENALVHKHFYSLDTDAGRNTLVEEFFAKEVEPAGARAIKRIVDERRAMSLPGLRQELSWFLAFQHVRGEATRRAKVEQLEATMKLLMSRTRREDLERFFRKEQGIEMTDSELDDLVAFARATDKYDLKASSETNVHLDGVIRLALDLVRFFAGRRWRLLEFGEPILVTGDEPIGLVGRSLSPGAEPLGVGTAPELVFATDPRHALVMVRPDLARTDKRSRGDARMAEIINCHIAFGCHRFIVRQPGTDPLRGVSLPDKAPTVRVLGDYVIMQPRLSAQAAKKLRLRREPSSQKRRRPSSRKRRKR